MNLTSLKSLHYGTRRRVLCAVLATVIGLCAVMVALPGLYQVLFNQTQAVSNCHSQLSESPEGTGLSTASSASLQGDTTGSTHQGSSTVCSGEFVSAEGVSLIAFLSNMLFAVFFILPFAVFGFAVSTQRYSELIGSHPFSGQLRSHLGLRRIHVWSLLWLSLIAGR